MKEFLHRIFRSKEKSSYQETFELDRGWGVLIDGQIKIAPLSPKPGNRKTPLLILAPGNVLFLRDSANTNMPSPDLDRTTRLVLSLAEGEKLWVEETNVFNVVDIVDPFAPHLICRYTSPKKFILEKVRVYESDYDLKSYEILIGGRRKILLAFSPQGALKGAESGYYNVDRKSVREVEFSEGFRRVYRIQKRGGKVPLRLAKYFCLAALRDPDL